MKGLTQRFVSGTSPRTQDARTLAGRLRDLEAQVAHFMEPERKAAIGARLKQARENSPYSQKDLAEAGGVELRTYQFWEAGRGVTRAGVDAVAKRIGIDPEVIWSGDAADESQLDRIEQAVTENTARLETIEGLLRELATEELLAALAQRLDQRANKPAGNHEPGRRGQAQ